MRMLGGVLFRQLQKGGIKMGQCIVKVLQFLMLCKTIIVRGIDLMIRIVRYIYKLLAPIVVKLGHLLVRYLIIVVGLIKVGIILALHKLGQIGQRLVTTVRKIRQPASKQENTEDALTETKEGKIISVDILNTKFIRNNIKLADATTKPSSYEAERSPTKVA